MVCKPRRAVAASVAKQLEKMEEHREISVNKLQLTFEARMHDHSNESLLWSETLMVNGEKVNFVHANIKWKKKYYIKFQMVRLL